jgi:hypothetical protein
VGYKMWLEEYKKSQSTEPNTEAIEAQLWKQIGSFREQFWSFSFWQLAHFSWGIWYFRALASGFFVFENGFGFINRRVLILVSYVQVIFFGVFDF